MGIMKNMIGLRVSGVAERPFKDGRYVVLLF